MGRGGRSSGGGRSFPSTPRRSSAPKPAARQSTPPAPVEKSSGGLFGGSISSTIADGLAWGASSEISHRIMDTLLGPRTIRVQEVGSEAKSPAAAPTSNGDACGMHSKAFQDCLNSNGSEISKCQFYMDMLADCKRNSGAVMSA